MSLEEVVARVEIVERGGFEAAAEGLGVPASGLSRRTRDARREVRQ